MRAISTFIRDVGIWARSCSAWLALRMRVSMSAIGSVSIVSLLLLPGALGHAGDHALVGELPQADPAEPELLVDRARTAAPAAARVGAGLELRRALPLRDHRLLGHSAYCSLPAANGRPSSRSSANPASSVFAVVVIVTSSPRIWSIES